MNTEPNGTPGGKTPPLQKRRPFASKRSWLGGFEGSAREFKHMVGEHSTREGDQALQVEWQQNLNSIFNDILLLLRSVLGGYCIYKQETSIYLPGGTLIYIRVLCIAYVAIIPGYVCALGACNTNNNKNVGWRWTDKQIQIRIKYRCPAGKKQINQIKSNQI